MEINGEFSLFSYLGISVHSHVLNKNSLSEITEIPRTDLECDGVLTDGLNKDAEFGLNGKEVAIIFFEIIPYYSPIIGVYEGSNGRMISTKRICCL